jgi:hypothetical protein
MQPETQSTQHKATRSAHQGAARGSRRRPRGAGSAVEDSELEGGGEIAMDTRGAEAPGALLRPAVRTVRALRSGAGRGRRRRRGRK